MSDAKPGLMTIVGEALELTDPTERLAYLDRVCGEDAALRERVLELLSAHAKAGSFLEPGIAEPPVSTDSTVAFDPFLVTGTFDSTNRAPEVESVAARNRNLGTVIAGRYTLVDVIGEGGMGSVYLAQQSEPVKRQVAIKLIKTGMDSKSVLARFDAERQALALMDHPNIARIYDGGVTDRGQPYFVMELVKGVPLTEYCDLNRLTVDARLQLFVGVCQAVQHAHQKGIIHRDLKPGNVIVTEVDGRPTPKVIDFGVAKATEQKLTDQSFSDSGAIVGTPTYMSPEQADPTSMDTDTRTDVYALGVMLYELLTGSPPIDSKQFKRGAILEMLRMVREVEPPRPSTKLSTADALPNIAANRNIDPAKLSKLLQGDLDWVVMKAIEKDRNRRYDTANGFARDVQRYLANEAVDARPPSRGYRLKKFVRRNRVQVGAAVLVALALVGGMIGTGVGLIEARRQAEVADGARANAVAAADAERKAKEEAEANLGYASKANDILAEVFVGLDPKANYPTLAEFRAALKANLSKAATALDEADVGDPLVSAGLQEKLGLSLLALGDAAAARLRFERALALRTEKLGPDHPDTMKAGSSLAFARQTLEGPKATLSLFEDQLTRRTAILGPDHPDTLMAMNNLGTACERAGQLKRALELFEKVYARLSAIRGPTHKETLISLNNLAGTHSGLGAYEKASGLHRQVYEASLIVNGADHPDTIRALQNQGVSNVLAGKVELAVPLLEQALSARRKVLGENHPDTLSSMTDLGYGYHLQKKYDLALPMLEEALRRREAVLGKDHRDTLSGMNNLALAYAGDGLPDKALSLYERAAERMAATLGVDHPDTLKAQSNLATAYRESGRPEKAIALLELVLEREIVKLGQDHPSVMSTMGGLANAYKVAGQHDKAIRMYLKVLDRRKAILGMSHPDTVGAIGNLGTGYMAAGRYAEAVATLEEFIAAYRKLLTPERVANLLAQVGPNMATCGRADLAEAYLREALEIRQKANPDAWSTANSRSLLGGVLLSQKKYADAEPLLLKGYEGMKATEKDIPRTAATRLPEALDRLIELYTAIKKPDEMKKYYDLRAKYPTSKVVTPPPEKK